MKDEEMKYEVKDEVKDEEVLSFVFILVFYFTYEIFLGEKEKRNVEQLIHNLDAINGLLDDMITYSRADSGLITLDTSM